MTKCAIEAFAHDDADGLAMVTNPSDEFADDDALVVAYPDLFEDAPA